MWAFPFFVLVKEVTGQIDCVVWKLRGQKKRGSAVSKLYPKLKRFCLSVEVLKSKTFLLPSLSDDSSGCPF